MSDHNLENAVMKALSDNRRVHADEIAVEALDGDVILRGTVGSLGQQAEAARTARRVLGVRAVEDELRVRPMFDGRADADTEAAVIAALIADDQVHATDVGVDVHHGTVTLTGLVEVAGQRDRAERIALRVGGVTSVHNRLKVLLPT